jgi:hypothetical protein
VIERFPVEFIDCDQNSPEWIAARAGIPTASEFSTVMAKGRGGGESLTRKKYLYKLAAERIIGQPVEVWGGNAHTERGHEMEPEARALYAFMSNAEPKQVGFIRRGPVGASPDSLIGDDGLLEIKTKLPHLQVELLESKVLPPEHKAQLQGQLWISGRAWVDFFSYWPGLPPFQTRVHREPVYIAEMQKAVVEFLSELDAITARISLLQEAA